MKYKEMTHPSFLLDEFHFIYKVQEEPDTFHLYIKSEPHDCPCPKCGAKSRRLHATYQRTLQDTPLHGKQTWLHANVYKYCCSNPSCSTHVFTEPLSFAHPSQVRTDALNTFILGLAIFLSNESASKILKFLGVSVSNDAIQHLYDRIEWEEEPEVKAVGIDDVALKKGHRYGTAIYDLKDHHLIALLEGREAKTLKEWLLHHPKIKLVARDRASAYATAIREVLPNCTQVADRFHLLQNLLAELRSIFQKELPTKLFIRNGQLLHRSPKKQLVDKKSNPVDLTKIHYDNRPPRNPDGSIQEFDHKMRDKDSSNYKKLQKKRKEKQTLVRKIQKEWQQNPHPDLQQMAQKFQLPLTSLKKDLQLTVEEVQQLEKPRPRKSRKKAIDAYLNLMFKMMRDGFSDETIYFYLHQQGYSGKDQTLWRYLYILSKNNFPNRPHYNLNRRLEKQYPADVTVIQRHQLFQYLLTLHPKKEQDPVITRCLPLIEEKYPVVSEVKESFKSFHDLLMGKEPGRLDEFLKEYQSSFLRSFCTRLKKDIAPVKNAISLDTSSGFVEGNNNKFKLIKRMVYGRSGFVNLAKKCYLAFSASQEGFSLQSLIE